MTEEELDFLQDGALKTEEELADVWKVEEPVELIKKETEVKIDEIRYAPRGKFHQTSYVVLDVDRSIYIQQLHEEAIDTRYGYYQPITSTRIKHIDRNDSLNFYTVELRRVIPLLLNYYGKGELVIINGFRSPQEIGVKPHSVGIALDIKAESREHADRIMNAAYLAGIPTIIPGGRFETKEGYVHLDLAPTAEHIYDAGYYGGPWT